MIVVEKVSKRIDENSMSVEDIETLEDEYCKDCCHNCDECYVHDFVRSMYRNIQEYNDRI